MVKMSKYYMKRLYSIKEKIILTGFVNILNEHGVNVAILNNLCQKISNLFIHVMLIT